MSSLLNDISKIMKAWRLQFENFIQNMVGAVLISSTVKRLIEKFRETGSVGDATLVVQKQVVQMSISK